MKSFRLFVANSINRFLPESCCCEIKRFLYCWAGAKIGTNVRIYSSVKVLGVGDLEIGDDVHLGSDVLIYLSKGAKVKIGSHVDIAPRVALHTGTHNVDPKGDHIAGAGSHGDVIVGDGCWIGVSSTILAGVELQGKTLVAAGSVVTKSPVCGNCLVAGVPAKIKKSFA